MDESDLDFDSYWEEEARNPIRNRIRIGRQYQAQVPPLLTSPDLDTRRLSDLETLTYAPSRLSDEKLNEYLAIAKSIGLFVQALDNCQEGVELDELPDNLDELTTGWEIGGPTTGDNSPTIPGTGDDRDPTSSPKPPALLKREKKTSRAKKASKSDSVNSEPESTHHSPLKPYTNHKIQKTLQGLSSFIQAHRPQNETEECNSSQESSGTIPAAPSAPHTTDTTDSINLGNSANLTSKQLLKLVQGTWSAEDAAIFARALQVCGKNFSAIKKDYLPWKAVRAIIEFYYLSLDKENEKLGEEQSKKNKSPKNKSPGKRLDRSSTDDSKRTRKHDGSGNSRDHDTDEQTNNDHKESNEQQSSECQSDTITIGPESVRPDRIENGNSSEFAEPKFSLSGQEVKALRAKPVPENGSNGDSGPNSSLGSLSLFLHGELVLKLDSQAQDGSTCQKWVESSEALPKKKRAVSSTIANGNGSTPSKSLKRLPDRLSKDDTDDLSSVGGGDVSGSDDDSRTSTESSSVIASSPSSSSTVTGSAKKARVKVENLSNGSTGPLSSPSGGRRHSNDDERQKSLPAGLSSLQLLGSLIEASGHTSNSINNHNATGSESLQQTLLNLAKAGKCTENGSTVNGISGPGNTQIDLTRHHHSSSKTPFNDYSGFLSPPLSTSSASSPAAQQHRQRNSGSAPPLCGPSSGVSSAPSTGKLNGNAYPFTATAGGGQQLNGGTGRHYKKSSKSSK